MFRFAVISWLSLSFVSISTSASGVTAKCSVDHAGKAQWVQLKLNSQRKIVMWDSATWGRASTNSIFRGFAENVEEYGYEWQNSFVAPNGYSILELGTTADSTTVGVNLAQGKGFFKYKDLGSGSGNLELILACTSL